MNIHNQIKVFVNKIEHDMQVEPTLKQQLSLQITKFDLITKLSKVSLLHKLFAAYLLSIKLKESTVFELINILNREELQKLSQVLNEPVESNYSEIILPFNDHSPLFKDGAEKFEIGEYDPERIEFLKQVLATNNIAYDEVIIGQAPEGLNRKYSYQVFPLNNGLVVFMCPQMIEATYVIKSTIKPQQLANLTKQELQDFCNRNQLPFKIIKHDNKEKWKLKLTKLLTDPDKLTFIPNLTTEEKLWEAVRYIRANGKRPKKGNAGHMGGIVASSFYSYIDGIIVNVSKELQFELDQAIIMLKEQDTQRFQNIIDYTNHTGRLPGSTNKNTLIKSLGSLLSMYKIRTKLNGNYSSLEPKLKAALDDIITTKENEDKNCFQNIIDFTAFTGKFPSELSSNPLIKHLGQLLSSYRYSIKRNKSSYSYLGKELKFSLENMIMLEQNQKKLRFQNIVDYIRYNKKIPSTINKNFLIRHLGRSLRTYITKTKNSNNFYTYLDTDLKAQLNELIQQYQK